MAKCVSLGLILVATLCSYCVFSAVVGTSYTYTSGPFTIVYDPVQTPSLRVARDGRTVWFTSASNSTFVTAARVEEDVQQNGGTFLFTLQVQEVCSDMKITGNGSRTASADSYSQVSRWYIVQTISLSVIQQVSDCTL